MATSKYLLDESQIPDAWYNIVADMPNPPAPPLNPKTRQPAGPDDLAAIFPEEIIKQEVSQERWIPIPEPVRDIYRLWRPTPLYRARRLEKLLDTPARLYYKYEGVSPAGSHKPNTAVAQAYYNKAAGMKRLVTETGAGQWGSSLGLACRMFDLECRVYMVRVSYEQKPYRRHMMETWGAEVLPSPSRLTNAGRTVLERNPDSLGSLGIAISEAVEEAAGRDDTNYSLGSVLNHVLLHQTVIGEEARKQFEMADDMPDVIVAGHGGGSNFAGLTFPFIREKFNGSNIRIVAVEPEACPTLTRGRFTYDFGDTVGLTPLLKMYTLGHNFMPAGIHAGGLRYHGAAPLVSQLLHDGFIEARALRQTEVFESALTFARSEGIIPAPESAHAIHGAIQEALRCKEEGRSEAILFGLSGHGHFDMSAYESYLQGRITDFRLSDEDLAVTLSEVE